MDERFLAPLRAEAPGIALGISLLFLGLAACGMAAIRGRRSTRTLLWFGIFTAIYGGRLLAESPIAFGLLPRSLWGARSYVIAILTYMILVPAVIFWWELSLGGLRRILRILAIVAAVLGVFAILATYVSNAPFVFEPINNLLAICFLIVLAVVNVVPPLARKYLVIPSRVSTLGTSIFALAAVYANLRGFLRLPSVNFLEPAAFAVFVFTLGYVAAQQLSANERRLLAIEKELAIAREIQNSILPCSVPNVKGIEVNVAYRPMNAVAGDFYDFAPVDANRAGFLIADVSGHGVPAALIASMIKIAMASAAAYASDPAQVLRELNRVLSGQLRGQFVSAAYLWLDAEAGKATYAAAGHPPLLRWHKGELQRIESNGLLFGVFPDSEYPVCELRLDAGDRFILYTDGIVETEDAAGHSFGESKMEKVIQAAGSSSAADLSERILSEISRWLPAGMSQQDDLTLMIVDVVKYS